MNMVDGSTLLTTIFVLVDDWYQQKGYRYSNSCCYEVQSLPFHTPPFRTFSTKYVPHSSGKCCIYRYYQDLHQDLQIVKC
ncbi:MULTISPECIES: hypothetical protein [unclassified Nostoc]|uniref:hypothetical protein n=1 Tax=unclassified Nostoc TaxID=2593658 RepID=UPI001D933952|nr:hypothetical protein [Nostoc sp. JL23]MBN3876532.1 hypothetical protein [Nostoc sp. JL23]